MPFYLTGQNLILKNIKKTLRPQADVLPNTFEDAKLTIIKELQKAYAKQKSQRNKPFGNSFVFIKKQNL